MRLLRLRLIRLSFLLLATAALITSASPTSGSTTCPSSGAKRVNSVSTPAITVTIQAPQDNEDVVYLGGPTISSTTGIALNAGDAYTFEPAGNTNTYNLFQIYFACANNNDLVTWFYN